MKLASTYLYIYFNNFQQGPPGMLRLRRKFIPKLVESSLAFVYKGKILRIFTLLALKADSW